MRLQLWRRIDYLVDAQQNCKVHARAMLAGLLTGTLLLFDLGYFGFEWLDELTTRSLWYVSRLREKTSYTMVHTFYQGAEVAGWPGVAGQPSRAGALGGAAGARAGGLLHA